MIPKVIPSTEFTGFRARVDYICKDGADIITRNLAGRETAAIEMDAAASLSRRCRQPSYHVVISWAELEKPTRDQMVEAADRLMDAVGMADHQGVYGIHRDRDHWHIHVVANRVHPITGKAVNLSHDYAKAERVCREVEYQQGWSRDRGRFDVLIVERDGVEDIELVPAENDKTRHLERPRPLPSSDLKRAARTGQVPLAELAPAELRAAMIESPSWAEVHAKLAELGVAYEQKGSGAILRSMHDAGDVAKPSVIDRDASIGTMSKRLGAFIPADVVETLSPPAREVPNVLHKPDKRPIRSVSSTAKDALPVLSERTLEPNRAPPPARERENPGLLPNPSRADRGLDRGLRGIRVGRGDLTPGVEVIAGRPIRDREHQAERQALYAEYQTMRDQLQDQPRRDRERAWIDLKEQDRMRREAVKARHRTERDAIYKSIPRGIVRGVLLWFQERAHKREREALRLAEVSARLALREVFPNRPRVPTWREFVETRAKEGDERAQEALNRLKWREKGGRLAGDRQKSPSFADPERELDAIRKLPLVAIARRFGYELHQASRPTDASVKMVDSGGDTIVIKQDRAGGDRWFSVTDAGRNGGVVEFVQSKIGGSLGNVRQAMRADIGDAGFVTVPATARPMTNPDADHVAARRAWMTAKPIQRSAYLESRGLSRETIAVYSATIRQDARGNLLFGHTDQAGNITGFEVKNREYAGFAKGGVKNLAVFGDSATAARVVITESGIDALSKAQLEGRRQDSAYVSLGGAPGRRTLERLMTIAPRAAEIVIATDNDLAGEQMAHTLRTALGGRRGVVVVRGAPPVEGEDWNGTLRADFGASGRAAALGEIANLEKDRQSRDAQRVLTGEGGKRPPLQQEGPTIVRSRSVRGGVER